MPPGESVINIAQIRDAKCDMNILIETLDEAPDLTGFRASLLPSRRKGPFTNVFS
jgi:hypothetical protein